MGGIIGKLSFDHDETLARPVLEQMLATLRHRGSIGRGIHVAPGIALAWCDDYTASITRPPVATTDDRAVHAVADASLTNAPQLRRELEQAGIVCRGRTDADLIAYAYDAWGDACVDHLRGSFAFAIWDTTRDRLLLARDVAGTRPLFFAVLHGHGVVFASEIRALLQDPGVSRDWCPQAIDAYLALGYVPAPLTIYQRISKLEPGHRLSVEGRRLHVERYWTLPEVEPQVTEAGRIDDLTNRLRNAVAAASGNGPSGVLYSGGVASTALLAVAESRPLTPITVAMEEDPSEVMRSHAAALHLGFEPVVDVTSPDITPVAQQFAAHLDEPIADPAAIAQYSTCLTAREQASSALAGHGATIFSGADRLQPRLWAAERRRELYTRAFAWEVRNADPFTGYLQPCTPLSESALIIAERASTAVGLQLRFPFLDRDLLEFTSRCAPTAASPGRHSAMAASDPLRRLLERRLPEALLPPVGPRCVHPWLAPALAAMVPAFLLGRRFDGRSIVSRPALQRLWDEHAGGRRNHSHRLWSLLMLEFWFREFIDGDAVDEPLEYAILKAA